MANTDTEQTPIDNVSDTALWVAVYRARESKRPDALFQDPLAEVLAGKRGEKIADYVSSSAYTEWSVVIRTHIIDRFVHQAIADGVDTILNLGCGLDTRPYRLDLPATLRWIEVDFPHMIRLKNEKLALEKPKCKLDRFSVDLADNEARTEFLNRIALETKSALVITEGVIPYLSQDQVGALARDLRRHGAFRFWIVEYFAPFIYRYLRAPRRMKEMKNAPFRFFPEDWFAFFDRADWKPHTIRYIPQESDRLGRQPPYPWWVKLLRMFMPNNPDHRMQKSTAYVMLEQKV